MKKCIAILIVLMCSISQAASLKWDAVVAPAGMKPVLGYIVYFSKLLAPAGEVYNYNVGDVTELNLDSNVLNLEHGAEYTFYVTVYNADGESDPSNTVNWIKPVNSIPGNKLPDLIINVPDSGTLNITIRNE